MSPVVMKQNMCVTIDEEIHQWLRKKPEMMSRIVNRILMKAMIAELKQDALKRCTTCNRYEETHLVKCPHCIGGKMVLVE